MQSQSNATIFYAGCRVGLLNRLNELARLLRDPSCIDDWQDADFVFRDTFSKASMLREIENEMIARACSGTLEH